MNKDRTETFSLWKEWVGLLLKNDTIENILLLAASQVKFTDFLSVTQNCFQLRKREQWDAGNSFPTLLHNV